MPQKPKVISHKLESRLARYAVLTGAALASMKPLHAGVVTVVLPSPVALGNGTGGYDWEIYGNHLSEYLFTANLSSGANVTGTFTGTGTATSSDAITNYILGFTNGAEALTLGIQIESTTGGHLPGFWFTRSVLTGAFTASGLHFLGLQFGDPSNGQIHYGFAQFDPLNLEGFAYESTPNTPITTFDITATATPEPGALELLALGAVGLAALKKRRA